MSFMARRANQGCLGRALVSFGYPQRDIPWLHLFTVFLFINDFRPETAIHILSPHGFDQDGKVQLAAT